MLLYCSVTAYLHQRDTCYRDKGSAWHEAFPDRELTNFPNVDGARKGIQCCVLLFRRSVTNRVFAVCQMPELLCFLILFAEDVDPDQVLRRYQWSRSGGQGLCERCPRCIQVLPQFGMRGVWLCQFFTIIFFPPQFKVSMTQGAYWWSERRCNTCCTSERSSSEHGA